MLKNINVKKKYHKKYIYTLGISNKKKKLYYGNFGVFAKNTTIFCKKQFETIRVLLRRTLGKKTKIWLHLKKMKPITKKPIGVRMGKGKGAIENYIYIIQKDEILFEIKTTMKKFTIVKTLFKQTNRKSNIKFILIYA